jgi:RecA/RadA recombinase
MTSRKSLLNIKGFTEKKVSNIFNEANKIEVFSLFQKGSDLMNQRYNNIRRISTGSRNLDNIIGGGFESNSITELIGEKNVNITDFIHILTVNAKKQNSNNKIIFFDLENNFNKEKIISLAKEMNINRKNCFGNIILINEVDTFDDLMSKLNEISENNQCSECSLLIIDSLITIFQKLFKETLIHKSQINNELGNKYDIESKLGKILTILKRISILYNMVIIITRIINDDENMNAQNDLIKSDPNIEIILNYECKTRLKFKKLKNDKIKCIVLNSPMISEQDCKFIITEKGIIDC